MIVHCTRKLAAKLKSAGYSVSKEALVSDGATDSIGSWHANITTIQRRQCVVFCHDKTRFALMMVGVTVKHLKALDYWFQDLLVNTLLKAGIPPELIEASSGLITPLEFDTNCDRSVQGTLNQIIQELEWRVQYDGIPVLDLPIYSTSVALSDAPPTDQRDESQ